MRRATYALLAAYWTMCIVLYPRLPDRIAIHFNARGQADGWSDHPWAAWFAVPFIASVTVLLMLGISKLAGQTPHLWNVPEKKRFLALTPEQRAPILLELNNILDLAALYSVAVCIAVQLSVYENALNDAVGLSLLFHLVLWGGLIALVVYAFRLNGRIKRLILSAGTEATIGRTS